MMTQVVNVDLISRGETATQDQSADYSTAQPSAVL